MHTTRAHDGEATGLAACAGSGAEISAVQLRPGVADVAVALMRWALAVAGLVVALWAGSVLLATPASAAVVVPTAASMSAAKSGKESSSGGDKKSSGEKSSNGEKKSSTGAKSSEKKPSAKSSSGEKKSTEKKSPANRSTEKSTAAEKKAPPVGDKKAPPVAGKKTRPAAGEKTPPASGKTTKPADKSTKPGASQDKSDVVDAKTLPARNDKNAKQPTTVTKPAVANKPSASTTELDRRTQAVDRAVKGATKIAVDIRSTVGKKRADLVKQAAGWVAGIRADIGRDPKVAGVLDRAGVKHQLVGEKPDILPLRVTDVVKDATKIAAGLRGMTGKQRAGLVKQAVRWAAHIQGDIARDPKLAAKVAAVLDKAGVKHGLAVGETPHDMKGYRCSDGSIGGRDCTGTTSGEQGRPEGRGPPADGGIGDEFAEEKDPIEKALEGRIAVQRGKDALATEKKNLAAGKGNKATYAQHVKAQQDLEKRVAADSAQLSRHENKLIGDVVAGHRSITTAEAALAADRKLVAAGKMSAATYRAHSAALAARKATVYAATDELSGKFGTASQDGRAGPLDKPGASAGCDRSGAIVDCSTASKAAGTLSGSDRCLALVGISSGCSASSGSGKVKAAASCVLSGAKQGCSSSATFGTHTSSSSCAGSAVCAQRTTATATDASATCRTAAGTCTGNTSGPRMSANVGVNFTTASCTGRCDLAGRVDARNAESDCRSDNGTCSLRGVARGVSGGTSSCRIAGGTCEATGGARYVNGVLSSSADATVDCRDEACKGTTETAVRGAVRGVAVAGKPVPVRATTTTSRCTITSGDCRSQADSDVTTVAGTVAGTRDGVANSSGGSDVDCEATTCAGAITGATSGAATGDVARSSGGTANCTVRGAGANCTTDAVTEVSDRPAIDEVATVSGPVSTSAVTAAVTCTGTTTACGGSTSTATSARDTGVSAHSRGTSSTSRCTVAGGGCAGESASAASSAPDHLTTDPATGKPVAGQALTGPSSTSSSSAGLECAAGERCIGSVGTTTAAWDGAVAGGAPRTSQGSATCAGGTGSCQVQSVSRASSGPGAALAFAGEGQKTNLARLGTGPSAASAAGAALTCQGQTACTGKVTSAASALDPVVSAGPRGSRSEGSCTGVSGGLCQAVTNSAASSAPDANSIAPLVRAASTDNATVTSETDQPADDRQHDQQPKQPATPPAPSAPGSSANSGGPTVAGASSWTMADAALDCAGAATACSGTARSSAAGSDGPNAINGGNGSRGPPEAGSATAGTCTTAESGCRIRTSSVAGSGQVVADIAAEQRNDTADRLAEEAKQADHDAQQAAQTAARTGATAQEQKKAIAAAAAAKAAHAAAAKAAELATKPVADAPATTSTSQLAAACTTRGCTIRTAGDTFGAAGASHTDAACVAAATGCTVVGDASATITRNAGMTSGKKPQVIPGRTAQAETGSAVDCPEARCTATLNGKAVAVAGPPAGRSASAGTGFARCSGAAACTAQIRAGSSITTTAPGAKTPAVTTTADVALACGSAACTGKLTGAADASGALARQPSRSSVRATATCAGPAACTARLGVSSSVRSAAPGAKAPSVATTTAGFAACDSGGKGGCAATLTGKAGASARLRGNPSVSNVAGAARCATSAACTAQLGVGSSVTSSAPGAKKPAVVTTADGFAICSTRGCAATLKGTAGSTARLRGNPSVSKVVGAARCVTSAACTAQLGVGSSVTTSGPGARVPMAATTAGGYATCSVAGCTAALNGTAAAVARLQGRPARSLATGAVRCTGKAACTAQIAAGSSVTATAPGAKNPAATTSADLAAACHAGGKGGCTATLSGGAAVVAGSKGRTSRSAADGGAGCTGAARDCLAQLAVGTAAAASRPGAKAADRYGATSAYALVECSKGKAAGCATRARSTTVAIANGKNRSAATARCAATRICQAGTGGTAAVDMTAAEAACAGTGCRTATDGRAEAAARHVTARSRTVCLAGTAGKCTSASQVAASRTGAQAGAACSGAKGSRCSFRAESHATGRGAKADAVGRDRRDGRNGTILTSAIAAGQRGSALAGASCTGTRTASCAYSYRAESHASGRGGKADAAGRGKGRFGGGYVMTSATVRSGPGFVQAAASCMGSKGTRCRHSYSASISASAAGAHAWAAGSGGGGKGGGAVAVSAQASSGPGWASASASCSGARNCRHSYSAHAADSARYDGPGPEGSVVHNAGRAWASGSGGGGEGGGGVSVSAKATAGPKGATSSASCSGAANCRTSFSTTSVSNAYHDPHHYAHADASCSGGGSGGSCATAAVAVADAKTARAGASCAGSAGTACHHSYSAHSGAEVKTATKTIKAGTTCGDSGGAGDGGCGTLGYTEPDPKDPKTTLVHLACDGPGCRYSGVGDGAVKNQYVDGKTHQVCTGAGKGGCTIGIRADTGMNRDGQSGDVFGFCVSDGGATCSGSYSMNVRNGAHSLGVCRGVGTGGCHGESVDKPGRPVVIQPVCAKNTTCAANVYSFSSDEATSADGKLKGEGHAFCSTSTAVGGTGCSTSAMVQFTEKGAEAIVSCDGGGPGGAGCTYSGHTEAMDSAGKNTAGAHLNCTGVGKGGCTAATFAIAGEGPRPTGGGVGPTVQDAGPGLHHGWAIAGGGCSGSPGSTCTGGYETHVESGRGTHSTCTGIGAGMCDGDATPARAVSTGTGTGTITSHSPDEDKTGTFVDYGWGFSVPVTVGAATDKTIGRFGINYAKGSKDAVVGAPAGIKQFGKDLVTHVGNFGHLVANPRLDGESDEAWEQRVLGTKPGEEAFPMRPIMNESFKTLGRIGTGKAWDDLYWEPVATTMTALQGPLMLMPTAGFGTGFVVKAFTRGAVSGVAKGITGFAAGRGAAFAAKAAEVGAGVAARFPRTAAFVSGRIVAPAGMAAGKLGVVAGNAAGPLGIVAGKATVPLGFLAGKVTGVAGSLAGKISGVAGSVAGRFPRTSTFAAKVFTRTGVQGPLRTAVAAFDRGAVGFLNLATHTVGVVAMLPFKPVFLAGRALAYAAGKGLGRLGTAATDRGLTRIGNGLQRTSAAAQAAARRAGLVGVVKTFRDPTKILSGPRPLVFAVGVVVRGAARIEAVVSLAFRRDIGRLGRTVGEPATPATPGKPGEPGTPGRAAKPALPGSLTLAGGLFKIATALLEYGSGKGIRASLAAGGKAELIVVRGVRVGGPEPGELGSAIRRTEQEIAALETQMKQDRKDGRAVDPETLGRRLELEEQLTSLRSRASEHGTGSVAAARNADGTDAPPAPGRREPTEKGVVPPGPTGAGRAKDGTDGPSGETGQPGLPDDRPDAGQSADGTPQGSAVPPGKSATKTPPGRGPPAWARTLHKVMASIAFAAVTFTSLGADLAAARTVPVTSHSVSAKADTTSHPTTGGKTPGAGNRAGLDEKGSNSSTRSTPTSGKDLQLRWDDLSGTYGDTWTDLLSGGHPMSGVVMGSAAGSVADGGVGVAQPSATTTFRPITVAPVLTMPIFDVQVVFSGGDRNNGRIWSDDTTSGWQQYQAATVTTPQMAVLGMFVRYTTTTATSTITKENGQQETFEHVRYVPNWAGRKLADFARDAREARSALAATTTTTRTPNAADEQSTEADRLDQQAAEAEAEARRLERDGNLRRAHLPRGRKQPGRNPSVSWRGQDTQQRAKIDALREQAAAWRLEAAQIRAKEAGVPLVDGELVALLDGGVRFEYRQRDVDGLERATAAATHRFTTALTRMRAQVRASTSPDAHMVMELLEKRYAAGAPLPELTGLLRAAGALTRQAPSATLLRRTAAARQLLAAVRGAGAPTSVLRDLERLVDTAGSRGSALTRGALTELRALLRAGSAAGDDALRAVEAFATRHGLGWDGQARAALAASLRTMDAGVTRPRAGRPALRALAAAVGLGTGVALAALLGAPPLAMAAVPVLGITAIALATSAVRYGAVRGSPGMLAVWSPLLGAIAATVMGIPGAAPIAAVLGAVGVTAVGIGLLRTFHVTALGVVKLAGSGVSIAGAVLGGTALGAMPALPVLAASAGATLMAVTTLAAARRLNGNRVPALATRTVRIGMPAALLVAAGLVGGPVTVLATAAGLAVGFGTVPTARAAATRVATAIVLVPQVLATLTVLGGGAAAAVSAGASPPVALATVLVGTSVVALLAGLIRYGRTRGPPAVLAAPTALLEMTTAALLGAPAAATVALGVVLATVAVLRAAGMARVLTAATVLGAVVLGAAAVDGLSAGTAFTGTVAATVVLSVLLAGIRRLTGPAGAALAGRLVAPALPVLLVVAGLAGGPLALLTAAAGSTVGIGAVAGVQALLDSAAGRRIVKGGAVAVLVAAAVVLPAAGALPANTHSGTGTAVVVTSGAPGPALQVRPGQTTEVQEGDTYSELTSAMNVGSDALAEANPGRFPTIASRDHISTGEDLQVPATWDGVWRLHTTLWDLARRFHLSVRALLAANPRVAAMDERKLPDGLPVTVPGVLQRVPPTPTQHPTPTPTPTPTVTPSPQPTPSPPAVTQTPSPGPGPGPIRGPTVDWSLLADIGRTIAWVAAGALGLYAVGKLLARHRGAVREAVGTVARRAAVRLSGWTAGLPTLGSGVLSGAWLVIAAQLGTGVVVRVVSAVRARAPPLLTAAATAVLVRIARRLGEHEVVRAAAALAHVPDPQERSAAVLRLERAIGAAVDAGARPAWVAGLAGWDVTTVQLTVAFGHLADAPAQGAPAGVHEVAVREIRAVLDALEGSAPSDRDADRVRGHLAELQALADGTWTGFEALRAAASILGIVVRWTATGPVAVLPHQHAVAIDPEVLARTLRRVTGRVDDAGVTIARAETVAWWGARLAEADGRDPVAGILEALARLAGRETARTVARQVLAGTGGSVAVDPATLTADGAALLAELGVVRARPSALAADLTEDASAIVEQLRNGGAVAGRIAAVIEALGGDAGALRLRADAKKAAAKRARGDVVAARRRAVTESGKTDRGKVERARKAGVDETVAREQRQRFARSAAAYRAAEAEAKAARDAYADLEQLLQSGADTGRLVAAADAAATAIEIYRAALAAALPPREALATGFAVGELPLLAEATDAVNRLLAGQGNAHRFTELELADQVRASLRSVANGEGLVVRVAGPKPVELRIAITLGDAVEDVTPDELASQLMVGSIPQGGRSVTAGANRRGSSFTDLSPAALAPETTIGRLLSAVGLKLGRNVGTSENTSVGASGFVLDGGVADNRGDSVLLRVGMSWEFSVRGTGDDPAAWPAPVRVDRSGAGLVAPEVDLLSLWVSHTYSARAPPRTTPRGQLDGPLPHHAPLVTTGLDRFADDIAAQFGERGAIGTPARDQIRVMVTTDVPGRLTTAVDDPAGLVRVIVDGSGRPIAVVRVRSTVTGGRIVGVASIKEHIEDLFVAFSGASGSASTGRSDSFSASLGHALGFGLAPGAGWGRSRSTTVGTSSSSVAIHPAVHRYSGHTIAQQLQLVHTAEITWIDGSTHPDVTVPGAGTALVRMAESAAYRYGLSVDVAAVRTVLPDGTAVMRDDPVTKAPAGRTTDRPAFIGEGPSTGTVRGAGHGLVRGITNMVELRRQVEQSLKGTGLLPGPATGQVDPLELAQQWANQRELAEQLSAVRLQGSYDQAAQQGLVVTLLRHRPADGPEHVLLRIRVEAQWADMTYEGHTGEWTVVGLDIGSNTAGRSSSTSTSWNLKGSLSGSVGDGGEPAASSGSASGEGQLGRGRGAGSSVGATANQVTLVEGTSTTAIFRLEHTIVVERLLPGDAVEPLGEVTGSAHVLLPSDLLPEVDPLPEIAQQPVTREVLQRMTALAADFGDVESLVAQLLPAGMAPDSPAAQHLRELLSVDGLRTHLLELIQAGYGSSLAVRAQDGTTTRFDLRLQGRPGTMALLTVADLVLGDIHLALSSHGAGGSTSWSRGIGGSLAAALHQLTDPKRGHGISGSRSTSGSAGWQGLGIWGRERLVIELGRHYVYAMDLGIDVSGGRTAGSTAGTVVFALPERDALVLYGDGVLDLPVERVADVVDRYLDGTLALDEALAHRVLTRYAGTEGARHSTDVLAAAPAAPARAVTLPEHLQDGLGQSAIEQGSWRSGGAPTELFDEVLGAVENAVPGALGHDPVLWQALSNAFAGKRWAGRLDAMLDGRGFRLRLPARVPGHRAGADRIEWVDLRITARLGSDATHLGTAPNTLMIIQDYGYGQQEHSASHSAGVAGGVQGNVGEQGVGASGSLSTGRSDGRSGSVGNTSTRLDGTATFDGADRIGQAVAVTIEVRRGGTLAEPLVGRTVHGDLVRLIPNGLIDTEAEERAHDPRQLPLPTEFSVEGVQMPTVVGTVTAALRKLVGQRLAAAVPADLDHLLAPNARSALLRRMVAPGGHRLARIPLGGRRYVDIVLGAVATGGRVVVGGREIELRTVNRDEHRATVGMSQGHVLPVSRVLGLGVEGTGIAVGVSSGAQSSHGVSDTGGNRGETSLFGKGSGATIEVGLDIEVRLELGTLRRGGTSRIRRTLVVHDTGTGYLTLFERDLAAARYRQTGERPATGPATAPPTLGVRPEGFSAGGISGGVGGGGALADGLVKDEHTALLTQALKAIRAALPPTMRVQGPTRKRGPPPHLNKGEELLEVDGQQLVDELVQLGMPRDEAEALVERLVMFSFRDGTTSVFVVLSRWVDPLLQRGLLDEGIEHERLHLKGVFVGHDAAHADHTRGILAPLFAPRPAGSRVRATGVAAAVAGGVTALVTGDPTAAGIVAAGVVGVRAVVVAARKFRTARPRAPAVTAGQTSGTVATQPAATRLQRVGQKVPVGAAVTRVRAVLRSVRAVVQQVVSELRLYVPVIWKGMLWVVAKLLGADAEAAVAASGSPFPHVKFQRRDNLPPVSRLHQLTLRERIDRLRTRLRHTPIERAFAIGPTVSVAGGEIVEIPLPGQLGHWVKLTVLGSVDVIQGLVVEDDVNLKNLLNPSRWLATVPVARLTFRFELRAFPIHFDVFPMGYSVIGRQLVPPVRSPKVVGWRPLQRLSNWARAHDFSWRTLPGLRYLTVLQLGFGVGFGDLGNLLEVRKTFREITIRWRGTDHRIDLVAGLDRAMRPFAARVRRGAGRPLPGRAAAWWNGMSQRRAAGADVWRVAHRERALARIEATAADQRKRLAAVTDELEAAREDQRAAARTGRSVALDPAGSIGRRIARLQKEQRRLRDAITINDRRAAALRALTPGPGPPPGIAPGQVPGGPAGNLTDPETTIVGAASEALIAAFGLPEGLLFLVDTEVLVAAVIEQGARRAQAVSIVARFYAYGLRYDGVDVVLMTRGRHAQLIRLGLLQAVIDHEFRFHLGPDAGEHTEEEHRDDSRDLVTLVETASEVSAGVRLPHGATGIAQTMGELLTGAPMTDETRAWMADQLLEMLAATPEPLSAPEEFALLREMVLATVAMLRGEPLGPRWQHVGPVAVHWLDERAELVDPVLGLAAGAGHALHGGIRILYGHDAVGILNAFVAGELAPAAGFHGGQSQVLAMLAERLVDETIDVDEPVIRNVLPTRVHEELATLVANNPAGRTWVALDRPRARAESDNLLAAAPAGWQALVRQFQDEYLEAVADAGPAPVVDDEVLRREYEAAVAELEPIIRGLPGLRRGERKQLRDAVQRATFVKRPDLARHRIGKELQNLRRATELAGLAPDPEEMLHVTTRNVVWQVSARQEHLESRLRNEAATILLSRLSPHLAPIMRFRALAFDCPLLEISHWEGGSPDDTRRPRGVPNRRAHEPVPTSAGVRRHR